DARRADSGRGPVRPAADARAARKPARPGRDAGAGAAHRPAHTGRIARAPQGAPLATNTMRKFVMAEGIHSIVRSRARLAAAASSLLLLGACSLVPPSLRPMVEEQNPALFPSATPAEAAAKA